MKLVLASIAVLIAAIAGGFAVSAGAATSNPALAFVRETDTSPPYVWVASADGHGARELGKGNEPLLSPSGAVVAASSVSGGSVILYSAAGGVIHRFVTHAQAVPLTWSPDSRYLAIALYSTSVNGVSGAGLGVIDTTTDSYAVVAKGVLSGASFAADGSDRIVYGLSKSEDPFAPVNLYTVTPAGTSRTQITTDGGSLNPVWEARGIVFDHERLRGKEAYPAYQLWLRSGTHATQITHMSIPSLVDGLVPLEASAGGNRLIAEYEGEDTSYAWSVQLKPLRVHQITVAGKLVQGAAISSNGDSLLIDSGGFEQSADHGTIESIPFGASAPVRKLGRGGFPSWTL